jgi:hypothetical protein
VKFIFYVHYLLASNYIGHSIESDGSEHFPKGMRGAHHLDSLGEDASTPGTLQPLGQERIPESSSSYYPLPSSG